MELTCEFIRSTDGLRCSRRKTRLGPFCKAHAYYTKRKGGNDTEGSEESTAAATNGNNFSERDAKKRKNGSSGNEMVVVFRAVPVCAFSEFPCSAPSWNNGALCYEHTMAHVHQQTLQTAEILINLQAKWAQ
jgi:hypothetical protein